VGVDLNLERSVVNEPEHDRETFKEIYELVKGSLDRQIDEGQMLDSKMVQVFGAASVVVGLAGFSVSGGMSGPAIGALFTLALVSYSVVAYTAFRQLTPATYQLLNYNDVWRRELKLSRLCADYTRTISGITRVH
jgi:hypothetical protein